MSKQPKVLVNPYPLRCTPSWDQTPLPADEFCAMLMIAEERDLLERDRSSGARGPS